MPTIDIHEHVITEGTVSIPGSGLTWVTAPEMVEIMDRKGIDKAVVLPLVNPETTFFVQSNDEAFGACDMYPDRFIRFCNVDPRHMGNRRAFDFTPFLEYYREQGARGIGEVTAHLWWDDPRMQSLLKACDNVGFPFIFHVATQEFDQYGIITEPDLGGLERALRDYPNVKFLGHSPGWWSEVGPVSARQRGTNPKGKVRPGGRVPKLMRTYPNMYGDLSANSGFHAVSRDREWGYAFMDEFQDKLLFGLDVCYPNNDGCPLVDFMADALAAERISNEVYDKIMGGNAIRLLGLE